MNRSRELTATEKRVKLDSFVAKVTDAVKRYACFGCYENITSCQECTVKGQCKQETPRWAYR